MPQEAQVAVLFADVCGSTQLYALLGDARARAIIQRCFAAMEEATHTHGGAVIKTLGDEVMATFPTAAAAAEAACAMQDRITGKMIAAGRPISIRIGFHFGSALLDEGDVFGDVVNLLARIAQQAKAGQILTTSAALAQLPAALRERCRQIDLAQLRGRRDHQAIFELVWDASDITVMRPSWEAARQDSSQLLLICGNWQITLEHTDPPLTIGRSEQNDLVLPHPVVSRQHACIECRNGRFILTDQSANGTYVAVDSGKATYVHRDSHVLTGTGALSLGEALSAGSPVRIRYETA